MLRSINPCHELSLIDSRILRCSCVTQLLSPSPRYPPNSAFFDPTHRFTLLLFSISLLPMERKKIPPRRYEPRS